MTRDQFGTHASNVETGVEVGLIPLLALVSNGDEWDRYETLQWRATARYAAAHPDARHGDAALHGRLLA